MPVHSKKLSTLRKIARLVGIHYNLYINIHYHYWEYKLQHSFQYISSKFIKEDAALSTDTALDCERSRTGVGDADGCAERGGAAGL